MQGQSCMQIGKNGLTPGTIECLKTSFKTRHDIKVVMLKSAGHDREKVKMMADEIIAGIGRNYTYRIVGFTIFLKKWRREKV